MTGNSTLNTEATTTNASVADRLPPLDEELTELALTERNVEWAAGMVEALPEGGIHQMTKFGLALQIVSRQKVRCITVIDHPVCWDYLAMMVLSFERAGIDLQLDPYTVIRPFDPVSEEETPPKQEVGAVGMEVV